MKTSSKLDQSFHHDENSPHFTNQRGSRSHPFLLSSGTFPFPSILTPSHHNRANHSSHDTQHPRNEIISHPREESIKSQREKYSGKKVHAYHTVK